MNLYSSLEARDRSHVKKVHWYDFILHPLSEFLRKYVVQKGFLEGIHGLILASIAAQVKMALYMKIWEIQNQKSKIE
jgi:(heptosyl)LPS beta-1,4-glucosyltransferase